MYITPFALVYITDIDKGYEIKPRFGIIMLCCISALITISAFTADRELYVSHEITPELSGLIKENDKGDGLYTDYVILTDEKLPTFLTGAVPLVYERRNDSIYAQYYAGREDIKKFIKKYDLKQFVFRPYPEDKTDDETLRNPLYSYLKDSDRYKLLYEDKYYCYFVEKAD